MTGFKSIKVKIGGVWEEITVNKQAYMQVVVKHFKVKLGCIHHRKRT